MLAALPQNFVEPGPSPLSPGLGLPLMYIKDLFHSSHYRLATLAIEVT
jgi:hypothetical protein